MSFPLGLAFINNIKFTVELQIVPWKCHVFFFFPKVHNNTFYIPFYRRSCFFILLFVYVGFLTYSDPDGNYPTIARVEEAIFLSTYFVFCVDCF